MVKQTKNIFFLTTTKELIFETDEIKKICPEKPVMSFHDKNKSEGFIYSIKFKRGVVLKNFFGKSEVDLTKKDYPKGAFNNYLKTNNPKLKYCVKKKHTWSGYSFPHSILGKGNRENSTNFGQASKYAFKVHETGREKKIHKKKKNPAKDLKKNNNKLIDFNYNKKNKDIKNETLKEERKKILSFFREYNTIPSQQLVMQLLANKFHSISMLKKIFNEKKKNNDIFGNMRRKLKNENVGFFEKSHKLLFEEFKGFNDFMKFSDHQKRLNMNLLKKIEIDNKEENFLKKIQIYQDDSEPFKKRFNLFYHCENPLSLWNQKFTDLFIDGTGFRVPIKKAQMFVISACEAQNKPVSLLYVITNDLREKNYVSILNYLQRNILKIKNKRIHCDFEQAILNACKALRLKIRVCFFHFAQIIVDNTKKYKTSLLAQHDIVHSTNCSKLMHLLLKCGFFLHKENLVFHIELLNENIKNNLEQKLVDHIVGSFFTKKYSEFMFQKIELHQTNNIAEAFNSRLEKFTPLNKPSLNQLMNFLIFETKRNFRDLKNNETKDVRGGLLNNDLYHYVNSPRVDYISYKDGLQSILKKIDKKFILKGYLGEESQNNSDTNSEFSGDSESYNFKID